MTPELVTGLEHWALARPEIFLAVATSLLLLYGVLRGEVSTAFISVATAVALLATAVLLFLPYREGTAFAALFITDRLTTTMKALVLVGAAITVLMSRSWFEHARAWRFEYPLLVALSTLGMMLMISANDLMSLYVGLELQSLALYVIAAFQRDSERSTEAGVKYFVLGSVASGMLLFGASLIYGYCGGTAFVQISQALLAGKTAEMGTVIGLVFVVAGLAFKVSAVPFHMWTPDVYEGAPTPVTALFSVAPKIAAISLTVSVLMGPFKPLFEQWQQIIIVASILSMAWGAFAALRQPNIKRLMAYSSIANVGYVLLGLASGTEKGIQSVVFYLSIYMVMTLGVFAVILLMKRRNVMVESIADLAGLSRSHPLLALAMALFMFSLAGIPPLAGFWGKLYIFMAAVEAKLFWPAVLGVLASVVASYYYLRIIKVMYFDEGTETLDPAGLGINRVVALAAALLVAVFSLAPQPLSLIAAAAAKGLFP
jgi:NADH-quinone oxidoreductase subunit N